MESGRFHNKRHGASFKWSNVSFLTFAFMIQILRASQDSCQVKWPEWPEYWEARTTARWSGQNDKRVVGSQDRCQVKWQSDQRVVGSQDGCQVKWPEWPKSSGKPGRLPGEVARMAIGQSGQWLEWLLSTLPSCYRPLVSRSGLPVPLVPTIWTLHYGF